MAKNLNNLLQEGIAKQTNIIQLEETKLLAKDHSLENKGITYFVNWDEHQNKYYVSKQKKRQSRYAYKHGLVQIVIEGPKFNGKEY